MGIQTVDSGLQLKYPTLDSNYFNKTSDTADAISDTGTNKFVDDTLKTYLDNLEDYEKLVMTEAEFMARAARRREMFGGSGFVEWGKHVDNGNFTNVNQGLSVGDSIDYSLLWMGRVDGSASGSSTTGYPVMNTNGFFIALRGVALAGTTHSVQIAFPDAPSTTTYNNNPRNDLVFLEVWHELISDKDVVYPYGNVQYGAETFGGITLANDGSIGTATFQTAGNYDKYSLFGNWQSDGDLVGYAVEWSTLSVANKRMFLANPEHNIYLNEDGELVQVRYRVRVVQGPGAGEWWNVSTYDSSSAIGYNDASYIKPKGKQVSVTSDTGASTGGLYGAYGHAWTDGITSIDQQIGAWLAAGAADTAYTATAYNGLCFAVPIALVRRRNTGAYHPQFNSNGAGRFDEDGTATAWYALTEQPDAVADCFDGWTGAGTEVYTIDDGAIADAATGRPDGLYYDEINERDVWDLRFSAWKDGRKGSHERALESWFNDAVAGEIRGREGEWEVVEIGTITYEVDNNSVSASNWGTPVQGIGYDAYTLSTARGSLGAIDDNLWMLVAGDTRYYRAVRFAEAGNVMWLHPIHGTGAGITGDFTDESSYTVIVVQRSGLKSNNTLLHCDIIGDPDNYLTAWGGETDLLGRPLLVDEDGASYLPADVASSTGKTWKLSRKYSAIKQVLHYDTSGSAWSALSSGTADGNYEVTATTNSIKFHEDTWGTTFNDADLWLVIYETAANPFTPADNAEVVGLSKDAVAINRPETLYGAGLTYHTINKIPVNETGVKFQSSYITSAALPADFKFSVSAGYEPTHAAFAIEGANPATKILPYLTRSSGVAYLQLLFKEMIYDTDWGDDATFDVVDDVSATTDDNSRVVLVGQKWCALPFFIGTEE